MLLKYKNGRSGFTLIEMLITAAVASLTMVVLTSAILFFYKSNRRTVEQALAVNSARKGIEFMSRDVREATFGSDGSYPIEAVGEYSFTFYSDIDLDDNIERVRYFAENTELKKGLTKPSGNPLTYNPANDEVISVVSRDTRNLEQAVPVFTYFDESGAQITNFNKIKEVRFVRVSLVVNVNPNGGPNDFTLQSSATLRNLKTNL